MPAFIEILSFLSADSMLPVAYKQYTLVGVLCFDKDRQPIRLQTVKDYHMECSVTILADCACMNQSKIGHAGTIFYSSRVLCS